MSIYISHFPLLVMLPDGQGIHIEPLDNTPESPNQLQRRATASDIASMCYEAIDTIRAGKVVATLSRAAQQEQANMERAAEERRQVERQIIANKRNGGGIRGRLGLIRGSH